MRNLPCSIVALAFAWTGPAFAQLPAPAGVIRSSVREVLLDVVVRDKHGKPVTNLQPGQVEVYEDGVRQEVRSFRLVSGGEVRTEDEKEAAEAKTPGAQLKLNPLRTVNLVCLVFSDLNAETRDLARRAAREFVNNELRPNTFIGVFSLDDAGLKPLSPFSNNREHLLKAVDLAAMNQLRPLAGGTSIGAASGVTNAVLAATINMFVGPGIGLDVAALVEHYVVNSAGQVRTGAAGVTTDASNPMGPLGSVQLDDLSGMRDLDALMSLVRQLSPLPYQKTVLLLSTGLTRPQDQMEYWRSLVRRANQGGVTFYGLDVYGLNVCQDDLGVGCTTAHSDLQTSADVLTKAGSVGNGNNVLTLLHPNLDNQPRQGAGAHSSDEMAGLMNQDSYVRNSVLSANKQAGLRDLAESTGGFLIANTNNTEQLLKHVMEDVDTHYEVTYQPSAPGYDGKFRKIEVKLTRPSLDARTREGYYALPRPQGKAMGVSDMAGLRALNQNPRPSAFDYSASTLRFGSAADGTTQYAVVFNVPIADLTSTPDPAAHTHRYHASLLALARGADGQVEDWVSRDVPANVADQFVPGLQTRHMTWERSFHLPPGRHTIETVVVDAEGNRSSARVLQIDNPASSGPDLSDIMLAQRVDELNRQMDETDPFEVDGRRVIPLASTNLSASANPFLYFVLYPQKGDREKARVKVQFLHDGRQMASKTMSIPDKSEEGEYPMLITAAQKPGSYQVHITLTQGKASAERTLSYNIAAK